MRLRKTVYYIASILYRDAGGCQLKRRMYWQLACVLGIIIACSFQGFGSPQEAKVHITVKAESSEASLFEPLYAVLSVQNNLDEEIGFDLGLNGKAVFEFSITMPDGRSLRTGTLEQRPGGEFGLSGKVALPQGRAYTQRLLLNEWYDFPTPGEYTVRLNANLAFWTPGGRQMQAAEPSAITVLVGQKDENRLRELCSDLTRRALASVPPHEAETEAALALSHIGDPIAIPFLRQVLENGWIIDRYAAEGLGRLGSRGNIEAIDTLVASRAQADIERRSYITGALIKANSVTKDAKVKLRVEGALSR
jgi:PBS lyase HEAT-like repeat